MAWRNVALPIANLTQSLVNDFTWCDNPTVNSDKVTYTGINPINAGLSAGYVVGDSSNGLNCTIPDQYTYNFYMMYNNDNVFGGSFWYLPTTEEYSGTTISYISCVDDDTQQGIFLLLRRWQNNAEWGSSLNPYISSGSAQTHKGYAYRFITGNEPHVYTWSSVPAISGKNGILSLTQILNINDGEPVENVTNRGNLDFSKKTKVNTLVNSAYEPTYKEDQTKASVEYEIPEAEYQYTKLVYKKKKIPKSPNDGTAIDIGADDTEAFVSGLEENITYYFVVFTNRTKSNAYKFKTGKNAPPEGIFKIRITTSQGVKDNDFKEVIEVTRV